MIRMEIYPQAIIAILGVAYPILLQVISQLDEKYASTLIVDLFEKERERRWFPWMLCSALIAVVLWTLCPLLPQEIWRDCYGTLMDRSLVLLAIVLVISFFALVRKTFIYYRSKRFIEYLIHCHEKDVDNKVYFNALSDISIQSINKQYLGLSEILAGFFYQEFQRVREMASGSPVVYPKEYYSSVYRIIEEIASQKGKRTPLMNGTAGSAWFLGYEDGYEISEETYRRLWWNLRLSVDHEQDDLVLAHWKTAHQYFELILKEIAEEYDQGTITPVNQNKIDKRQSERQTFLRVHDALGGLLLYKNRYSCIKRIFGYTQSLPPHYVLLPDTMDDIFSKLNYFYNIEYFDDFFSFVYPFSDEEGLNSQRMVGSWTCSYIALLFLRQYTIRPYLVTMKPLEEPSIPQDQRERKQWLGNMDYLIKKVSSLLDNHDLMKIFGEGVLAKEWCKREGKKYPTDWLEDFKIRLQAECEKGEIKATISKDKQKTFFESSQVIIENTLDSYNDITNANQLEDYKIWHVSEQIRYPINKQALTERPTMHIMNYDTFLAEAVSSRIREKISDTFMSNINTKFLLREQDLFEAVSKLELDSKYLILANGIGLKYFISYLHIDGLTENRFRDIPIISRGHSRILGQSLTIIKKEDLPNINPEDIDKATIDNYSLQRISDKYKLYASIVDLNSTSEEFKKTEGQGKSEDELNKSALLCLFLSLEIRWKKGAECVQLKLHSEYRDDSPPNELSNIEKLYDKPSIPIGPPSP